MKTMTLFKNLFIMFIILFIFVSYMSNAFIMSTYTLISSSEIICEEPKIEIIEAKSTNMNGFVFARITNNTENNIDNKYIKLDFYSEYNNNLGTKYLKINNLTKNTTKEFNLDHNFEGVKSITGTIVETMPETESKLLLGRELTKNEKLALGVGTLIVTYYMPARFLFNLIPF